MEKTWRILGGTSEDIFEEFLEKSCILWKFLENQVFWKRFFMEFMENVFKNSWKNLNGNPYKMGGWIFGGSLGKYLVKLLGAEIVVETYKQSNWKIISGIPGTNPRQIHGKINGIIFAEIRG